MTRLSFIQKIFNFYKASDESGELKRDYDCALSVTYPIDWYGLYKHVVKTTEKRILPMPKYFVDKLPQFRKISEISVADEGCIIRVILDDDRYYDFTVVSFDCDITLNRIKNRFQKQAKIKKIIHYPKETTLIGEEIFFNINIPKPNKMTKKELEEKIAEKEEELRKQIKILFAA